MPGNASTSTTPRSSSATVTDTSPTLAKPGTPCVSVTDSAAASSSGSAVTVTVRRVLQFPAVNVSACWSPGVEPSASTPTDPVAPDMVIATSAAGASPSTAV